MYPGGRDGQEAVPGKSVPGPEEEAVSQAALFIFLCHKK